MGTSIAQLVTVIRTDKESY